MFKDINGNYKLKIAFDFDDTLTKPVIFELAQHLIRCGHDVWIMTARISDEQYIEACKAMNIPIMLAQKRNADLLDLADSLGILDKIIYTNCEDKSEFFRDGKFDLLFDDEAEWHCNPICEAGGIAVNV